MNAVSGMALIGCVIMNLVSGYFLFTEKLIEEKKYLYLRIYAGVFFLLNMGIAVLLSCYYDNMTILTIWKRLSLLSILWPIGYIDFQTSKIPNRFILLGLGYRGVILIMELLFEKNLLKDTLVSEILASFVLLVAAILCSLCIKNSIGFGDMKLFIVMGLTLGLENIGSAMTFVMLLTFFVCVVLLFTRKKTRKDSIPFGPFLMVGIYASVILTGM